MNRQQESTEEKKNSQPLSPEPEQGSDLADRLKEVEGVSDDAAVFLAENWSRFLGLIVLLILLVFGYNEFKASRQGKLGQASEGFSRIQQALKEIENTSADNKEQLAQELAALVEAKSWLLGNTPDIKMARERLTLVARNSDIIAGEALVTLARLASSTDEKTDLKALANEVLEQTPQLREQVESVFTLEGISLQAE